MNFDFDDHFKQTSKTINRVHKLMPIFIVLSIIMALLIIVGLGLGVYWLAGHV
jgi:hypothetical protein